MTDPEIPRHHKKSAGRKRFGIETRYVGKTFPNWAHLREWHPWYKRYRTEADRDKALATLRKKGGVWEYRKEETGDEKDHV